MSPNPEGQEQVVFVQPPAYSSYCTDTVDDNNTAQVIFNAQETVNSPKGNYLGLYKAHYKNSPLPSGYVVYGDKTGDYEECSQYAEQLNRKLSEASLVKDS